MLIDKTILKTGLLLIGVLIHTYSSFCQDIIPTKGTEFWVGFMDNFDGAQSLNLFVTSDENTSGAVSIPQQNWKLDFTVNANQTTTLTIPSDLAEHQGENQIISNKGILVETTDTVSVFAINFTQYTADGSRILPTRSLGTEYRVSSYSGLSSLGSELLIVATEDDTEVEIIPSITTQGGNLAGVPFTVSLDRGQSYQIAQNSASDDLTGTIIKGTENSGSCKPFAVFSGVSCANIPIGCTTCDHIFEQNFPTITWGTEYFLVPFEFSSGFTYKILANENGTNVSINGINNVILNAGEFYEVNHVNKPTCISSNLPISVVQLMEGSSCATTGDPAMMFLNDASQKNDNVTFSTVVSNVITNHGINVIMDTDDIYTLTLDGALVNATEFKPFPECSEYSYAQLSIPEGSHTLDSPESFTAYAFGLGKAESYSYSVGSFGKNPNGIIFKEVFCTDQQVELTIEENASELVWYHSDFPDNILSSETSLILETPIIPGVYVSEYSSILSGCPLREYYNIEVPEVLSINLQSSEFAICQNESIELRAEVSPANNFYEYAWSPNTGLTDSSVQNPIASPSITTDYELTISTPSECSSASARVLVNVEEGNFSELKIKSNDSSVCVGKSLELVASINELILKDRFDGSFNSSVWSEVTNAEISQVCGSVSGDALHFNGVGIRQAVTLPLDLTLGGRLTFALKYGEASFPCDLIEEGKEVVLEYSIDGLTWNFIDLFSVGTQNGWNYHSFILPDQAMSVSTRLRWRQIANSGINHDNWALDNVYISTESSSNLDYMWFSHGELIGYQVDTLLVNPNEDTVYVLELTDDNTGCVYKDSLFISAQSTFDLTLSKDLSLCYGQDTVLQVIPNPQGNYEFEWTPVHGSLSALNSSEIHVSPVETTEYSVMVTNDEGCYNSGSVNVLVSPNLDLSLTTSKNSICLGDSIRVDAKMLGQFDGFKYQWFFNDIEQLNDTSSWVVTSPIEDTEVMVRVTDPITNCFIESSLEIEVNGMFTVDAGQDVLLCNAENYNLTASVDKPGTYTWSWQSLSELNVTDEQSVFLINNQEGEFIVTATESGCSNSDTVLVDVIFKAFDLGENLNVCYGDSIEISTGLENTTQVWNTGEFTESIYATEEKIYSVTIMSDLGCSVTDSVYVTFVDPPAVELGNDLEKCEGELVILNAENNGADYLWNTGETDQYLEISNSGNFSVVVKNEFGCIGADSIEILFLELPVSSLPSDSVICEDESVLLDAENIGYSYFWLPSLETTRIIEVNTPNLYTVEISNQGVCSIIDSFELVVKSYPNLDLGEDIIACEGEEVLLETNASEDVNISWLSGENTEAIVVNKSGTYGVQLDNNQCFISDEVNVFYKPLPDINLPEELEVCFLDRIEPVYLDASYDNSTFIWNTGLSEPLLEVNEEGVYTVKVTSEFGCDSSFSAVVKEFCSGNYLYVPNAFTPTADGINDGWRARGEYVEDYHVQIYNKWGILVFESDDIYEYWTGNNNGGDYYCSDVLYTYKIKYRYINHLGKTSVWRERAGHISLIR